MQTIGILYATKTKHSQKLAEAIGAALHVPAQDIKTRPALPPLDLLFIVGGIYGGVGMPELLEYVQSLDAAGIKRAALVTNCASGTQKLDGVRKILEEKGIAVVDEFICRGGFLFVAARHPDQKDLQAAVDFAKRIAKM